MHEKLAKNLSFRANPGTGALHPGPCPIKRGFIYMNVVIYITEKEDMNVLILRKNKKNKCM